MELRDKYLRALDSIAEQVRDDPHVIALLLSGSLSYGTVWKRSDIDLELIVRDGAEPDGNAADYCLDEDGIEIHLAITSLKRFKQLMSHQRGGEGTHSYFGHGRLVFSKDDSLYDFFEENRTVGEDDAVLSFMGKVEFLLVEMYRAEKWITAFNDPLYSQRFLVACALTVADMVLLLHGEDPTRESLLRAMELEPELMSPVYVTPLTTKMTAEGIRENLKILDDFLMEHVAWWSAPILDYLADGEPRRASQLIKHFGVTDMFYPLSYLAEKGFIQRVTQPARVFKHSRFTLEEVAYLYVKEEL